MIKSKSLLAFLAAVAVGTSAAAVVALSVEHFDSSLPVYASAADDEDEPLKYGTGAHELTLEAGETVTFGLDANQAGYYGFELPYTISEEDGSKTYDDFAAEITVKVDDYEPQKLDANTHEVVFDIDSPSEAVVTLTSNIDVEFVLHITFDLNYKYLSVDVDYDEETTVNELAITAKTYYEALIRSRVGGYYTFTVVSELDTEVITFTIGSTDYTFSKDNDSFYAYIGTPSISSITIIADADIDLSFIITYSDTEPGVVVEVNEITVGITKVSATGDGVEYVFTNTDTITRSYVMSCDDDNSYVMVETEYGSEQILRDYDENWQPYAVTYTFTLEAGESKTFIMCTDDWTDATYEVEIADAIVVGTQTVYANYDGIAYVFTSEEGGTYTLICTDSNAYIMVEDDYGSEWVETPYTFTLSAGESITFLMATEEEEDDTSTYSVTIEDDNEEEAED